MKNNLICKICGAQIPEEAKFCGHCGAAQTEEKKVCHNCGEELAPDMAFCTNCGQPQPPVSPSEPRPVEECSERPGLFGRLKRKSQGEADDDGDVQYVDPDKFFDQTQPPVVNPPAPAPLRQTQPVQQPATFVDPDDEDLAGASDVPGEDPDGAEEYPVPSPALVATAAPTPAPAQESLPVETPPPTPQAWPEEDTAGEPAASPDLGDDDRPQAELGAGEGDAETGGDSEKDRFQAQFNADHYYDDRVPMDGGHQDEGVGNTNLIPIVLTCVGIFSAMFVVIKFFLMFL